MYTSNPPNVHGYYGQQNPANRPISDLEAGLNNLTTYVVPAWIYKAFTREFGLADIHDYGKVRKVASLKDVGSLVVTNCHLLDDSGIWKKTNESSWQRDFFALKNFEGKVGLNKPLLTDEEYSEYKSSVSIYEMDESFRKVVMARYRDIDEGGPSAIESLSDLAEEMIEGRSKNDVQGYRVEVVNNSLYIIVEEGFLSRIAGNAARLSFFQQVLKAAYAALPISTVNQSVWYRNYVRALKPAGA